MADAQDRRPETQSLKTTAGEQRRGRPFASGRSGNPLGRPKGIPNKVSREVREIAKALLDSAEYQESLEARISTGTLAPAMEALLWHHAYGKPKDTIELSGRDGAPLLGPEEVQQRLLALAAKAGQP